MLEKYLLKDYYFADVYKVVPFVEYTSIPETPETAQITEISFKKDKVGSGIYEKKETSYIDVETGLEYFYMNDVEILPKEHACILLGNLVPLSKHLEVVSRTEKIEILNNIKSYKKSNKNMVK